MWNAAVYGITLKHLLRSRKMIFASIVSVIPFIVAALTVLEAATWDGDYYGLTGPGLAFFGIAASIPLMCLLLAGGSIADDAEERTLSYWLVRPIPRATLYASSTLAVVTVAVGLALFQVITTWIVDVVYFSMRGVGQTISVPGGSVEAAQMLWLGLGIGLLIAPLAAIVYSLMFSAISVIFTRYHFFANLVWFLLWESLIGWVPVASAWLSAGHALRAAADALDPSVQNLVLTDGWWGLFGIPVVLVMCLVYGLIGLNVMQRRDFHITSAAT